MATYSNQHWLLSHIRNSFISTDDTGMCETVMQSDDLPKHFLRKYQTNPSPIITTYIQQQALHRKSLSGSANSAGAMKHQLSLDQPLQEVDFVCYPGLDQSDDEDIDLSTQSFDIQMYPEAGSHRFRSNTAQKLEKMELARRRAARTKSVNYTKEVIAAEDSDLFVRKPIAEYSSPKKTGSTHDEDNAIKSRLSLQLANSPKQSQNKFMEYARFDGTSQTGMQTKRINVFLNMLPGRERNYPMKVCAIASAKIIEVIGLVCYKATIQYPDVPLKSVRHYALYMTEDNDDMDDFPPLDNREPCAKFGFSHLTLAERRPLVPVTRIDYNNPATKSTASEDDKTRLATARSFQNIELNGVSSGDNSNGGAISESVIDEDVQDFGGAILHEDPHPDDYEAGLLSSFEDYRTFRLNVIVKPFIKAEATLGISGERIEIDHHKNPKFWTKPKAATYPIEMIAHSEITERHNWKASLRIYYKSNSSSLFTSGKLSTPQLLPQTSLDATTSTMTSVGPTTPLSPTSPGHYANSTSSPFGMFSNGNGQQLQSKHHHHPSQHLRFKHYDFETDTVTAEHICNKINSILDMRLSEVRREFLQRRLEKSSAKKNLKM